MNPIKKVYCRAFQFVFKMAIPVLPYRNPEILNSTIEISKYLKERNIEKLLIVTDKSINSLGLIEPLKNALDAHEIQYVIYDETVANPTVENVEEAKQEYIKNNCKAIIGFGGGSAIDCAKMVGAKIARPKKTISKMEGILKILKKTPLFIAVPTTAGTGSETTVTAVITDEKTGHKFPISDFCLIPDVAVLDPVVTKNLPVGLTATTGMDALTHAVEAYIGRSTVKSSREDALCAVKLISENLEKVYEDGADLEARANMLKASHLAGRAFSKSYVGYCHAIAHSLGGKYKIPHGLANAVLLPYVLESYGTSIYKKSKDLAVAMGIAEPDESAEKATKLLIEKIRKMNKNMGIPTKLKGIKKEDVPALAVYAEKEANPLYPVPKLFTAKELEKLYYKVME